MKTSDRLPSRALLLVSIALTTGFFFTGATSAQAQIETWHGMTGSWFTGVNWSPPGPPTTANDALIENGGTALIVSGTGTAKSLTLGSNAGDSGTLRIGLSGVLITAPGEHDDRKYNRRRWHRDSQYFSRRHIQFRDF
jgi:hypothetical protein